jgi:serine/threonine protein kinase
MVSTNTINKQEGGKVVASGGFGCIFKPALKCQQSMRETNKISKLMTVKHATDEYNQIQKFKHVLQTIPDYQNYFLIDHFTLCKPVKLTNKDLINYKKKCKALTKKNITYKNINNSLNKVLSLNMLHGGIDVEHFMENHFVSSDIIKINSSLIKLLKNGIIPMNQLNVYHCDIKDANVLVQSTNDHLLFTRLIDWGLSVIIPETNTGIPKKLYRRPFQYNVPFSSVLFNKEFLQKYNDFLEIHPNPDYFLIREFVMNYIFIWNEIRGPGHLSAINDIMKKFFIQDLTAVEKKKIKDHLIEYDFTYYYIIDYLSRILQKYTKNGKIELQEYFNTVFIKNIDIWGFVTIYLEFFDKIYKNFDKLNEYQMQFLEKIRYIIIHFLYENPNEPIQIDELINELTNLNAIIRNFDIQHGSKKLAYLKACGTKQKNSVTKTRKRKVNK